MLKKIIILLLSVIALSLYAPFAIAAENSSNNPEVAQGDAASAEESTNEKDDSKLEVKEVWARASIPSSSNSAAYFKITNNSKSEFVIISASATIANNVELHNSFVDEKGVSRMTSIDRVVVPAESTIEFKPGGMHVMLFNLKKTLKVGNTFKMNLIVENNSPITVEVEVRNQ